jgi:hypothetical protein
LLDYVLNSREDIGMTNIDYDAPLINNTFKPQNTMHSTRIVSHKLSHLNISASNPAKNYSYTAALNI